MYVTENRAEPFYLNKSVIENIQDIKQFKSNNTQMVVDILIE